MEEADPPINNNKLPLPPVTSKNRQNSHVDISDIITASNLDAKIIQDLKLGNSNSAESERKLSSRSGYGSIMDISKRSARGTKALAPLNIRGGSGENDIKREIPAFNDEETPVKDDGIRERMQSRENLHSITSLDSTTHRKSHKLKSLNDKKLLSRKESPESAKKLLRKSKLTAMEESLVGLTVSSKYILFAGYNTIYSIHFISF